MLVGIAAEGQVLLSESFDGTGFPPSGWTTTGTGTNYNSGINYWQRTTNGGYGNYPTPNTHSGAGMAAYEAYWTSSGGTSELVSPSMSFTATGNKVLTFWVYQIQDFGRDSLHVWVNTSATATGGTLLQAIEPNYNPSSVGWVQYTVTIPASYNGANNYIIFKAKSAFWDDIFLDDVELLNLVPCSGTVTAGTATGSPNPVCPNTPLTLTATGYTVAANMYYRWQSSPAGANTWTTIAGATTPVYTITGGITTATDYRFFDSCTNTGGGSSVSNTVAVTINSYQNCYCTPIYGTSGCADPDDINTITLVGFNSTGISQINAGCPSGNVNGYVNYTSLTPVQMLQGNNYSGTMNTSLYTSEYVRIWIDFNNDGVFSGTEQVSAFGPLAVKSATSSYTVSVPAGAALGLHRMRVRLAYGATPASSIDPCSLYGYGETRDYMVNILTAQPPAPTVTTNSPVCPGSTITITATSTYPSPSFTVIGPASYAANNTTGIFNIPNATVANAGAYNVTVTSGGFTSPITTVAVVVYNTPTNITTSNVVSPTTCLGTDGSFQICGLTASTGYTLTYRKNNVAVGPVSITSNASGCFVLGGLSVGSYDNIQVTSLTPSLCKSNIITSTVIVPALTPPPTPKPAYNNPLCPGATLQLSVTNTAAAVPGSQYSWTGPGSYTAGPNGTGIATRANAVSAFSGIYTVTVTTPTGCSAQDTITVTVRNPDAAPLPNNITYCQYDIAVPFTAQGVGLKWYDTAGNPAGTLLPGAPTPPTNVPGVRMWFVTQTSVCESPKTPIYVLIKPKPNPPSVSDSTIDYCQYEQVGPLSASGTAIQWFSTLTGGSGSSTAPTPSTLIPGTYFFYASQTVNGCESDRKTIRVIVKPKPEPPVVVSPLNLCQGDPMTPLTAVGKDLLWYTIPVGGVGVPVAPIINTGYEDSFRYYVTQTVNGCESDRALMSVYVRYKPNGIITAASQSVCQDAVDTFYYYGNARPDAEYVWFAPLSAQFISGQGTAGPVIIHFDTAGTSVVQLIINNKGCISNLVAAPITIRPLPKISYVNRQDVCENELVTVALDGIEPNITGYNWDFGSDNYVLEYGVLTTGGPFGIRYPTQGHYQISVTATKNFCNSKPIFQSIYVHPNPDAHISAATGQDPNNFCSSDTLHLSVRQVAEGATYTWTPAAYFQSYKDSLNHLVSAVVSHTSYVHVNVKTAFGCEATDSLHVTTKPCCGVYFANAFAPESKIEKNKTFKPITEGVHKINTFRVVNRWGQVVYETKVERAGWDGRYNGALQDMGTYYWYISYKCDGKNVEDRGEVLLMR